MTEAKDFLEELDEIDRLVSSHNPEVRKRYEQVDQAINQLNRITRTQPAPAP